MPEDRLFLGYETAFLIWRKVGSLGFSALAPTRVRSISGGVPSAAKIQALCYEHPDLVSETIDVLVDTDNFHKLPKVKCHIRSAPYPERSFYRLDEGVYVASPELCLMQLASKLSVCETVKLAMELCGAYAIDTLNPDPGFYRSPAHTSAKKLKSYADRLYRSGSRAKPTQFLRWVADGAASPRETALYMLLCMPPRFGGYGLAMPELNRRIDFSFADKLMSGKDHYDCDLYWESSKIAVEYDSALHHTLQEKQEADAIRRNMLEYKGVQVIVATRKQVNSPAQFDKLARQIASAVGKRLRIPEKKHIAARQELRKTLLQWDIARDGLDPYDMQ